MEVGAAPTGLALPVDEAGIPAVLRHPKEPLGGVAVLVHGIKVFGGVTSCVGILIKRTKHELANNKNRD